MFFHPRSNTTPVAYKSKLPGFSPSDYEELYAEDIYGEELISNARLFRTFDDEMEILTHSVLQHGWITLMLCLFLCVVYLAPT